LVKLTPEHQIQVANFVVIFKDILIKKSVTLSKLLFVEVLIVVVRSNIKGRSSERTYRGRLWMISPDLRILYPKFSKQIKHDQIYRLVNLSKPFFSLITILVSSQNHWPPSLSAWRHLMKHTLFKNGSIKIQMLTSKKCTYSLPQTMVRNIVKASWLLCNSSSL